MRMLLCGILFVCGVGVVFSDNPFLEFANGEGGEGLEVPGEELVHRNYNGALNNNSIPLEMLATS
jgi:hypothetical protein